MRKIPARIPLVTITGLMLSLFGYLIVAAISKLQTPTKVLSEQTQTLLGFLMVWLLAVLLLVLVRWGENRPLTSIGFSSITIKEILLAIAGGVLLSLIVPLMTWLVSQLSPSAAPAGSISDVTTRNSWFLILLGTLTAGVTEEIIFRGYIIERIIEITGKPWLAIGISVTAFILPHTLSWNVTHIVAVVLPLGAILSWLYVWKQNIIFNIIVHIVIDLPLVFIALSSSLS